MSCFQCKQKFPRGFQSRLWVVLAAASCEGLRVGEEEKHASRTTQQTSLRSDEQLDKLLTTQLSWAARNDGAARQEAAGLMETSTDLETQLQEESKRLMEASVDSVREGLAKRQQEITALQSKAQAALDVVRQKQLALQAASKKAEQALSDSAKIPVAKVFNETDYKSIDIKIKGPAAEENMGVKRFQEDQKTQLDSLLQQLDTQQVMQRVMQEAQALELKQQQESVAGKQIMELKKQHENQLKKLDQLFKVQSHDLQEAQKSQMEALKQQERFTIQAEEAAKQEALRRLEANSGDGMAPL